jgi:thiosulfate/3-mercaptopyruvate sulfurtransferase
MMIKRNAAARFWWMLDQWSEKVQVLNGGLQHAENMGFPINDKTETPKLVPNYTFDNWKHQLQQLPKWKTISKRELFGY